MTTSSKPDLAKSLRTDLARAEALRAAACREALASMIAGIAKLSRSRALLSVLPSFLASGVLTLIATAVIHWSSAPIEGRLSTWMESWLIAWAIVCPVAYVAGLAMQSVAASLNGADEASASKRSGLPLDDIAAAFSGSASRTSFSVMRNLKVKEDLPA